MKKFIKEHYILVIIGFLAILFLVFIFIGFRKMYFTSNGDVYGNRLEGIEKVPIKDDVLDKAKKELLDSEKVEMTSSGKPLSRAFPLFFHTILR